MLWLLPLLPVAAGSAMVLARRRDGAVTVIGATALLMALGLAVWSASTQPTAAWSWGAGLELTLDASGFSRVMTVLIPFVALPVFAFAAATEHVSRARLLALLSVFVGAMQLLVLAADLLTLLIGWELVGAVSWALVSHDRHRVDDARSAAQAFLTTRLGDLGLYVAAGLTFAGAGTFEIAAIEGVDAGRLHGIAAGVVLAAVAKSAQLPFSPWLFSAMAGPTPASALLHSATLVSAGAYLLIRLAPSFETVGWFATTVAGIGLTTAIAGGLVALTQRHIKRALAGSTSAQYGLMFLAIGAGSTAAAGAHLVAHALFKSLLFLAAGSAIHAAGSADLDRMRLGSRLPRTAVLAGIGALALAAVPPLGGAWSKEQIVAAALERSPLLGAATLVAAVLTAAYTGRLWLLAFGRAPSGHASAVRTEPGATVTAALGVLAAASALLGLLWLPPSAALVEELTGGALGHGGIWALAGAWTAIALAAVVVLGLRRTGRLATVGLDARHRGFVAGWFALPGAARHAVIDPVLALSRALAAFDDRIIDAGVRASAAVAAAASRALARFAELSFTAAAHGVAGAALRVSEVLRRHAERAVETMVGATAAGTDLLAVASRRVDDRGIDAGVEALAQGTGVVGERARQTQTGLAHQYYLYATVGAAVLVLTLVVFR